MNRIPNDIPNAPGCYLMRDSSGLVIYVGKAKNLRKRVGSYFLSGKSAKTEALMERTESIDYIITGNEYEALILENNLIKEHSPRYNILLKDGKSYPVIRITKEDFPRVLKTRRVVKDGSDYFGPYASASKLDKYLELVSQTYPIRKCKGAIPKKNIPCVYYHIGKCVAPCVGRITKEEYSSWIAEIREFLSGNDRALINRLKKEMKNASDKLDYEKAAAVRDALDALRTITESQSVEDFTSDRRDYIAISMRMNLASVSIMQFRFGRLIGKAVYRADCASDETEALLSFLVQYYEDGDSLPDEVFTATEIDSSLLSEYFKNRFGKVLYVAFPKEGKHYRILRMAELSASADVEKRLGLIDNTESLEKLREELSLERIPKHIEGFDIAELSGKYTVASLVVFREGRPSASEYRYFRIKSLEGKIDDFESMREAASRRYSRLLNEGFEMPDLIMVDGGIGQVGATREIIDALGVGIPVVGLAKKNEEIVFPSGRTLALDKSDPGLRVLIALRDECHRFATSLNRRLRNKEVSFVLLKSVEGVGEIRAERIMKAFGTMENLISATPGEISKEAGIPITVADRIIRKLSL